MIKVLPDNCRHVTRDDAADTYNKMEYLHNSTNHREERIYVLMCNQYESNDIVIDIQVLSYVLK
jgi:hypothetical protein